MMTTTRDSSTDGGTLVNTPRATAESRRAGCGAIETLMPGPPHAGHRS